MTTSDSGALASAYVWVWLPGAAEPVVAGRVDEVAGTSSFTYGRSYLTRGDAVPLYLPELPLRPGRIVPLRGLSMPNCLRDAGPTRGGSASSWRVGSATSIPARTPVR